jgi:hypothetical protein
MYVGTMGYHTTPALLPGSALLSWWSTQTLQGISAGIIGAQIPCFKQETHDGMITLLAPCACTHPAGAL